MSNFRRRLMMSFEKKYTPVKYLESTGTQYIDTGIMPNENTKIEIDGNFTYSNGTSIIGANPYLVVTSRSTSQIFAFRYNNVLRDADVNVLSRSKIVLGADGGYINGNLYATWSDTTFQSPYTLLLFARHSSNGGVEEFSNSRIYSCKIWDGDVLLFDIVPVIDKNNIGCMFNKVDKKCYYNQGTGEFLYE